MLALSLTVCTAWDQPRFLHLRCEARRRMGRGFTRDGKSLLQRGCVGPRQGSAYVAPLCVFPGVGSLAGPGGQAGTAGRGVLCKWLWKCAR